MEELIKTTDPATISFVRALLSAEAIDLFELDVHTSILEGSIGILPRRLMVASDDLEEARKIMIENGLAEELSRR